MAPEIRPTRLDELPELSRFLSAGFHVPAEAPATAPDVLRWKYFDPRGDGVDERSFVAVEDGRIVGHLGLSTGSFHGLGVTSGAVATLHMMDWLSARPGAAIGSSLMLRTHRGFATGYGLGGSEAGRSVGGGGGYRLVATVPVFRRALRLGWPKRAGGWARWGRDLVRAIGSRPGRPDPSARLSLRPASEFGPEVEPILAAYAARAAFTSRRPALLNHMLRYPRGGITGWLLEREGQVTGFGLLSLVPRDGGSLGKVVDCILADPSPALWHAAIHALTRELAHQGADVAEGYASTAWMSAAFRQAGYREVHHLEFRIRDKQGLIAPGAVVHLTPIEADYAYI